MRDDIKSIAGGKWWKVDFHLHTPGSYDYGHGQPDEEDQKQTTPEEFLKCCMEKDLDCIVVTDHNTFEWIPKLNEALISMRTQNHLDFKEIIVFPGIEISTTGNYHLLGIFDPDLSYERLCEISGKMNFTDGEMGDKFSRKNIAELIKIISENKGIAIPAHVDGPCGLFYEKKESIGEQEVITIPLKPTEIKSVLAEENLLALEVLNQTFSNSLYGQSKLKLSYVVGSDSHDTRSIAKLYTWVKMGTPNIEALRLALFDDNDGVKRSVIDKEDPNFISERTYIKSLRIENAQFIGRGTPYIVEFSPWLTNIIGGRGTGKSSLIKFLRLLLQRRDELPESLVREFDDFIKVPNTRGDKGMLLEKEDKHTTVTMEMVVEGVRHLLKWEQNITYEFDTTAEKWNQIVAIKDRFPVQIFSQKQLYEMTKDPDLLFSYLDKEWDSYKWKEKYQILRSRYSEKARKRRSLKMKKTQKEAFEAQLRDCNDKIAIFETESSKEILQKQDLYKKQKREVYQSYIAVSPFIDKIRELESVKISAFDINSISDLDNSSKEVLSNWHITITQFYKEINEIILKYKTSLSSFEELYSSLNCKVLSDKNLVEFNELMNELKAKGIEGIEKYSELVADRDKIQNSISEIGDIETQLSEVQKELKEILGELDELIKERCVNREKVIEKWNTFDQLHIELLPLSNLSKNNSDFRQLIGKDSEYVSEILEYNEDSNSYRGLIYDISVGEEIDEKISHLNSIKNDLLSTNSEKYGKRFNSHISKLIQEYPETIDEIITWIPEDTLGLTINISTSGKKQYMNIDVGSPGQRTSAILSLLFMISNTPIIIDQPEDDLDTKNITNIVVNGIKTKKKDQQIIIVTHNPNIVVNTNSEQIVQLEFSNGRIQNSCSGALQNHAVRDAICNVMEGGKEALEKRYYRIFKALS